MAHSDSEWKKQTRTYTRKTVEHGRHADDRPSCTPLGGEEQGHDSNMNFQGVDINSLPGLAPDWRLGTA